MKSLLKVAGGILVFLALLLVVLRITGLNPHDRIPGLWLTGDLVTTPVTDWSFTDQVPTIKLQTQSQFLLPHSVTINCVAYNGQLYVTSTYPAGPPRSWVANVMRDPHVRVKIEDKLYDRTAVTVTDPQEIAGVLQAKTKKYPQLKTPANATVHVFHIVG
jgi:F420H(2)-dependent quinone reductase